MTDAYIYAALDSAKTLMTKAVDNLARAEQVATRATATADQITALTAAFVAALEAGIQLPFTRARMQIGALDVGPANPVPVEIMEEGLDANLQVQGGDVSPDHPVPVRQVPIDTWWATATLDTTSAATLVPATEADVIQIDTIQVSSSSPTVVLLTLRSGTTPRARFVIPPNSPPVSIQFSALRLNAGEALTAILSADPEHGSVYVNAQGIKV